MESLSVRNLDPRLTNFCEVRDDDILFRMINGALHLLLAISYVHDVNFLNSHSPLNFEQLH